MLICLGKALAPKMEELSSAHESKAIFNPSSELTLGELSLLSYEQLRAYFSVRDLDLSVEEAISTGSLALVQIVNELGGRVNREAITEARKKGYFKIAEYLEENGRLVNDEVSSLFGRMKMLLPIEDGYQGRIQYLTKRAYNI